MLVFYKLRYIHAMKVNYFMEMNRSAIDKGSDKLNTQTNINEQVWIFLLPKLHL